MKKAAYIVALSLAMATLVLAVPAMGASANAHGQCYNNDDHDEGGEAEISANSDGEVNALDEEEAQSLAAALALFAEGTVTNEEDACQNTDDDDPEEPGEEDEDHISAGVNAEGESAGVCYDNEGGHTTTDCHNGEEGDVQP